MIGQTNWLFIIVAFFCMLGFLTAGILFFLNRNQSIAPRLLALILFSMSYSLLAYGLYLSGEFLNFPHLWRTPVFLSLCVAPLTYIYVRSVLEQAYKLRKKDLLFFLPAVLFTAQFIPFYILPASEKLIYIQKAMVNRAYGAREHEGLLPPGFALLFRMVYNLCIVSYTFLILRRWKQSDRAELLQIKENRPIFSWLVFLTVVLFLCFGSLVVGSSLQLTEHLSQFRLPTVTVMLSICFICTYLFLKPEILYGFRGWLPVPVTQTILLQEPEPESSQQPRRITIAYDQGLVYKDLLDKHFMEKHPYIKPRYSIKDLSAELGIPSYLLSSFINQEYGKNFNEFVNDKRVDYLIGLVKNEPQNLDYRLEVLGQLGGFSSRSSFIEAVKRKTGKTPSEVFYKTALD
jgi:AraC-like DNA-binding protein